MSNLIIFPNKCIFINMVMIFTANNYLHVMISWRLIKEKIVFTKVFKIILLSCFDDTEISGVA